MSYSTILGWFCKSGPYHNLSRKLHNLDCEAMQKALDLIAAGTEPAKAIREAKRETR